MFPSLHQPFRNDFTGVVLAGLEAVERRKTGGYPEEKGKSEGKVRSGDRGGKGQDGGTMKGKGGSLTVIWTASLTTALWWVPCSHQHCRPLLSTCS